MAVLRMPRRVVVAAFVLGVLAGAPVTALVVAPHTSDLVAVDELRGTVGRVSADGRAFVLDGTASFHVFATQGAERLVTGARVVVGVIHVADLDDVVLYVRSAP